MILGNSEAVDLRLSLVSSDRTGARVLTTLASNHRTRTLPRFTVDLRNYENPEQAVRQQLSQQLSNALTHLEQLSIGTENGRLVCDLLGLVADRNLFRLAASDWWPLFELFPWEDWRKCTPKIVSDILLPQLFVHADNQQQDRRFIAVLFGQDGNLWLSENLLQRYDRLYAAGLLPEALRDRSGVLISVRNHLVAVFGQTMSGRDRRQLGLALSQLRRQIHQRAIFSYLLPGPFSLADLQKSVENVCGIGLHTQNFRRDIIRCGLIEPVHQITTSTGGRPAKLFDWTKGLDLPISPTGLPSPRKKCRF